MKIRRDISKIYNILRFYPFVTKTEYDLYVFSLRISKSEKETICGVQTLCNLNVKSELE